VIRGFAAVARADPDVDLVVAGVGAAGVRTRFANLAAELGLAQRVQVLAYVSDGLIEALYAQAECLLFLSLYEGFGLPVLEAMARGVPVLASNTTSIPEVAGDAAILVDPTDRDEWTRALGDVLRSPARLAELSRRGIKRAADFSWERTAQLTAQVVESAVRVRKNR
jgi:glycosyltransferase involved in cell wall biosynthesis